MIKKLSMVVTTFCALSACSVQNNVSFTSQTGDCADGTTNAPYCMALTVQNNNGGQNWITNTNFPLSNLTLTVNGPSNVNYPTTQGSTFDPNNCLGSSINPGASCTFYLQLSGESAAVGQKPAINVTANYEVNSNLFGGGGSNASASLTVYETPNLLISYTNGWVVPYSANGFGTSYLGESENALNTVANDNYYGFLYMGGNQGVYLSGNGNYAMNATNTSTTIKGASNLLINGQVVFGIPPVGNTFAGNVYYASMQRESFGWQTYATGLSSVANNVSTINGSQIFIAQQNAAPRVYICNPTTSSGVSCGYEGSAISPATSSINALAFGILGVTTDGAALTGLVAGTNNGLWVESGTIGTATNQWTQAILSGSSQPLTNPITTITGDTQSNLYLADSSGSLYKLPVSQGNQVTPMTNWTLPSGQSVNAIVYDNSGKTLYVATSSGNLYACLTLGSCGLVGSNIYVSSVFGLNIVTSLTSS